KLRKIPGSKAIAKTGRIIFCINIRRGKLDSFQACQGQKVQRKNRAYCKTFHSVQHGSYREDHGLYSQFFLKILKFFIISFFSKSSFFTLVVHFKLKNI